MPDQLVESTLAMDESSVSFGQITSSSSEVDRSHEAEDSDATPVTKPTSTRAYGGKTETSDTQSWSCLHRSFKNHPLIDLCEMCGPRRYRFKDYNHEIPPQEGPWDYIHLSVQDA